MMQQAYKQRTMIEKYECMLSRACGCGSQQNRTLLLGEALLNPDYQITIDHSHYFFPLYYYSRFLRKIGFMKVKFKLAPIIPGSNRMH